MVVGQCISLQSIHFIPNIKDISKLQLGDVTFTKLYMWTGIDLLLPQLKWRIQEKTRKGIFEFRDSKFDNGDSVAVRDYKSANPKWKFERIFNKDVALH